MPLRALFLPALILLISQAALRGQAPGNASIRGQVLDAGTRAIAAADVEVTNTATGLTRRVTTDEGGYYSVPDLPLTGSYRIKAAHEGFAEEQVSNIVLRAGESASFFFSLAPQAGRAAVTVYGTVDGVRADSPQLGIRLDPAQIENTPILGRKITNLALLNSSVRPARGTGDLFLNNSLFVVGAGGRRQTSFVVDGSTGDDAWGRQTILTNVPVVAVQEMTVLTSSFSSEFGRTTGGVVNVNTRAGTNDWHGDLLGLWRPPGIQARVPLSDRRTADRLSQGSGMIAGPIRKDKTHFLLSTEISRAARDSTVTSPLAPQNFRGQYAQELALGRLDQQFSEKHTLSAKVMLDRMSDTNPSDAVGGLSLPSAARTFRREGYSAQLGETAILSPAITNDARLQSQVASPVTRFDPVSMSTQYVRPGLATEGESRSANLQNHQWQLADTLSLFRGRHNIRLGGDLMYSSSGGFGQEFGGGYVQGQFTLKTGVSKPVSSLTANDVQRYAQSFGNGSYSVRQWLGAAFIQDNWKVLPNLAIDAGLRYDSQSFSDDRKMVSPRAGFAWNPRGRKTVIRGGYGLYYSQLRANLAAGYRIGGPEGVFTFAAAPGQLGFPADLKPITSPPAGWAAPARDITVRAGDRAYLSQFLDVARLRFFPEELVNPRTQQFTFGVERELASKLTLSVDYIGQRITRIDRPLDLNAPSLYVRTAAGQVRSAAAADASRPIVPVAGGFKRVIAQVNDGDARYDALHVSLNRRFQRHFSLSASYTWSHTTNTVEPDVPSQDPNDQNLLGLAEKGTSLLDQRHRAVLSGWWTPLPHWSFGSVTFLASGRPYNPVTGTDNNGDASNTDRPVVNGSLLGRNTSMGTPLYDVQVFAQREFVITEHARLTIRAEGFNLLNHSNIVGRNATWGNGNTPLPTFGQALGGISNVDPSRQFQFLMRLAF